MVVYKDGKTKTRIRSNIPHKRFKKRPSSP
jgi:hypothetical protein